MSDRNTLKTILSAQRNEITEWFIYQKLAADARDENGKALLEKIAAEEKNHYAMWRTITKEDIAASRAKIWWYYFLARIFGLSFGLRLMERGERLAVKLYRELQNESPVALELVRQEQLHEEELIGLIDDARLRYMSAFVLGLNDALIELTGALAGLTLALQHTRLILLVALITGFAASLSMGASGYLSTKEEGRQDALFFGFITSIAYVITVFLLVFPYFFLANPFAAFGASLAMTVLIIAFFSFYAAVAKGRVFRNKFAEMLLISLGIAAINFGIGFAIKRYLGVNI